MRSPSKQEIAIAVPILLLLLLVFFAAGGIGLVQFHLQPPSDDRAAELFASSVDASESVQAYRYDIEGTATATYRNEHRSFTVKGQGAVNRSTRRIHITATGADDSSEVYVDGYTRYEPCMFSQYSNVEDVRYGVGLDRNVSWTSYTTLGELDTLQRLSHVYLAGNATVDGTRARVLVVEPNPTKLDALRPHVRTEETDRAGSRQWLRDVTVRLWISDETDRLLRLRINRVSRTGTFFGAHIEETFVYTYDYGPTTVSMPNETVDSKEECPDP